MIEDSVITAISTVGFPIVAFLIMTYFCFVIVQKNTEATSKLEIALVELSAHIKKE